MKSGMPWGNRGDDAAGAAAEAVTGLVRRINALDSGARSQIHGLSERLEEIEVGLRAAGARPASLKGVTTMVDRLARDIDDADENARSTVEGLRRAGGAKSMDSTVTDAIRSLDARIAAMADRGQPASPPSPHRPDDIAALRDRLDTLLARAPETPPRTTSASRLDATLQALEARIDDARARMESRRDPGPSREDAERVRRIEARLADIAGRLGRDGPPPRPETRSSEDLSAAIAEIAARQASLDDHGKGAPRRSERTADEAIDVLRADIAHLDEHLAAIARAHAEDRENRSSLADRIDALAADAPVDRNILGDIRHQLEALGASADGAAREATVLDRFDEVIRHLPDRGRLDALGEEISALRQSLENDDSPRAVSRLEMRISELARTIETSLTARQSASEVVAAGMASSLADIRGALDDLAVSHGAGPDVTAIAGLAANLAEIRGAIEGLAAIQRDGSESPVVAGLAADVARIRQMLDARDSADRVPEEQAVSRLESRLDDIAMGLDVALSRAPAADAIDGLHQRLENLAAGIEALNSRADEPSALDELKAEIIAVREDIANREPPRLDYLESQIHDLAARIETASGPGAGSEQLEELEARIAGLAGELERVTPRTAALQRVEENLMRLQAGLTEGRQESVEAAREAARDAVREFADKDVDDGLLQALRADLDQVSQAVGRTGRRTEETADSLQETLTTIVDRLSRLESEAEAETEAGLAEQEALAATGTYGPEPAIPRAPPIPRPPPVGPAEGDQSVASTQTSDAKPDLAALRELAASAADPERKPVDRRADFIAAARRAAQAAVSEAAVSEAEISRLSEDAGSDQKPSPFARIGQAIRNRRKPLLLAAAAIVLAIGAIQLFGPHLGKQETFVESEPPPIVAERKKPVADPAAMGAGSPTVPEIQNSALVAPPANARAAMALASAEGIGERFNSVFDRPAASAGAPERAVSDRIPRDNRLPVIGSDKLRAAATAGDPAAAFEIANRFAEGREVAKDLPIAVEWYRRAAEGGLAVAQYRYASLYERGQGVERDRDAAIKWYQRAADQGNVGAMHNLAVLLSEGKRPDHAKALEWFLAAANYGVKDSQYNLGVIYARGLGQQADLGESYKWFAVAAAAGDADAAARRDEVAGMFTPDQLASARASVQAWRPKPPLAEANTVKAPVGGWDDDGGGITASDQKALVMKIQALLTEQGYDPGPADGIQGPKTREAVRAFQQEIGVAATGMIDPSLATALAGRKAS